MTGGGYRRRVEPVERVVDAGSSAGATLLRAMSAGAGLVAVVSSATQLMRLIASGAIERGTAPGTTLLATLLLPILAVAAFVVATRPGR